VRVRVTLAEAALGAKVDVPTPKGTITLRVPPGASAGTKLRIKGHGVAAQGRAIRGTCSQKSRSCCPKTLDDESREEIQKLDEALERRAAAESTAGFALVNGVFTLRFCPRASGRNATRNALTMFQLHAPLPLADRAAAACSAARPAAAAARSGSRGPRF